MKRLLALLLAVLSWNTHAADEWRTEDTQREAVYLTIVAIDYLQTRQIIRECEAGKDRYELNPLLPACPSVRQLNLAIAATAIGHVAIAHTLPHEWRGPFQLITLVLHGSVVTRNFNIGITGRF